MSNVVRPPAHEDAFVRAVEAAYAAATTPALWPDALQAIADCFDDVGAILIYRRGDGSSAIITNAALRRLAEEYNAYWWQHDFRLRRSFERGFIDNLDTITDRHVVTMEETETHPFYAEFLAGNGLKWFAGTTICPESPAWAGLALERSLKKPAYSDEELVRFSRLARHAESALRLGIRLINAELTTLTLSEALARLGTGVFVIDVLGSARPANEEAERLLGDALMLSNGRLTARFERERRALAAALADVLDVAPGPPRADPRPVIVRGVDGDAYLAVYVMPVARTSGGSAERWLSDVRAVVLAIASRRHEPADPTLVRDLLGVTLAEARVASLVAAGAAPREAGAKLGITEETARTTLKRVFAKSGVSRQSELAALLTRIVLG